MMAIYAVFGAGQLLGALFAWSLRRARPQVLMEADSERSPDRLAILVVGTDTVIEALPARPIQLANACGDLGFDLAIPLSWGDELIAEATIRALQSRGPGPALLCTCPLVRQRLLHGGADLAISLISLVSPPVAIARHLRATLGSRLTSISFVGRCPGAKPPEYDAAYTPEELFGILSARGIKIGDQPDVFVDRIPPDRQRYASLPGGCPTPQVLWQRCNETSLKELDSVDFVIELAQHLLSTERVLVDAATAVGCSCSGITHSTTGYSARVAAASLEPPRSSTPILGIETVPDLSSALPEPDKSHDDISFTEPPSNPGRSRMAITPPNALKARK
jgi:hypothetical protein